MISSAHLTRPYPGAFSTLDGVVYLIWEAALLPGDPYPHTRPGQALGPVIEPHPSVTGGQVVACGQGAIVIVEVEDPAGNMIRGRELSALEWKGKEWSNGR